jgi:hypothetical protein
VGVALAGELLYWDVASMGNAAILSTKSRVSLVKVRETILLEFLVAIEQI